MPLITAEGTIHYPNGTVYGPIPEEVYNTIVKFLLEKRKGSITLHSDGKGGVSQVEQRIFSK